MLSWLATKSILFWRETHRHLCSRLIYHYHIHILLLSVCILFSSLHLYSFSQLTFRRFVPMQLWSIYLLSVSNCWTPVFELQPTLAHSSLLASLFLLLLFRWPSLINCTPVCFWQTALTSNSNILPIFGQNKLNISRTRWPWFRFNGSRALQWTLWSEIKSHLSNGYLGLIFWKFC